MGELDMSIDVTPLIKAIARLAEGLADTKSDTS